MTKEKKEQLSNRLVFNFGVLLCAALLLLYVNTAIKSTIANAAYIVILVIAILSAAAAVFSFFWGSAKQSRLKNYSAIFLGVTIGSIIVYLSKFSIASFYTKSFSIIAVYIAMLVYFIIIAIYTAVMLRKPTIKNNSKEINTKPSRKKKR